MIPFSLSWFRCLALGALTLSLPIVAAGAAPMADPGSSPEQALFLALKQAGAEIPAALAKAVGEEGGEPGPERESGGPDAFGYVWLDDNEAAGPVFSWVDISVDPNAVALTPLTDDGFIANIAMGIDFPFYGTIQTTVNVAMNGFINFGTGSGSLSNTALPTAAVPNNLIAVFWDDLDPGDGVGAIHTLSDPAAGTFTVQWTGVPDYPGPNGLPNTFQVILDESGSITIQYLDMQGDHLGCTVGIENDTGTIGLQATFNGTGMAIANEKAVRFALSEVDIIGPTITHTPLGNTDLNGGAVSYPVSASIVDMQSGVAGAVLHYQVDGGAFSTVAMTEGTPPTWSASIPGQAMGASISYYITATDTAPTPNTSTSSTWTFRIIDYTLPPAGLTATEGLLDIVNIAWTAPVWLASLDGPAGPRPLFEDYLGRYDTKEQAWQVWQEDLAAWEAGQHSAERTFLNYNVYRDGEVIGTSTTLTYTDYPPEQNTNYTYHVTALFSSGESDPSNSDTGNMVGRPTEGGPDTMGYSWVNSNNEAGPGFDWVDISPTGTTVTLTDDSSAGPFDLGINFPYYDSMQTQVYIGSNGFLSFGAGYSNLGNTALPTAATPNNIVAGFWDDLYPLTAGMVKYLSDPANGRFIVQYTAVPHCCNIAGPPETFQIILSETGDILVQYLDMQGNHTSASVGTENSTGTIGLQVNYNDSGGLIANNVAVAIIPMEGDFVPPLIAHTPLQSVETELMGGYSVDATITDESGIDTATLVYSVNGGAAQNVAMTNPSGDAWTALIPHLDEGSTVAYHIEATDNGANHIQTTSATWTFSVVSYTWPPVGLTASDGGLLATQITWLAPINPGLLTERFGANWPRSEDEALVRLTAEGLSKIEAYNLWHGLFEEAERAFLTYNVYRNGQLIGSTTGLAFADNLGHGAQPDLVYSYTVKAQFTAGESDPSNADAGSYTQGQTNGGADAFGYIWRNSSDANGPDYEWVEISAVGTSLGISGDDVSGNVTLPWSFPFYDATYSSASVCSNGFVNFGAASNVYTNVAIPNTNLPNAVVFAFWDDLYIQTTSNVYYYHDVANDRFIVQWDNVTPLGNAAAPHTFEAILYPSGNIKLQYEDMTEAQILDATIGIEDAAGVVGLGYLFDATGAPLVDQMAIEFTYPLGPDIAHTPLTGLETEIPGNYAVNAEITSEVGVASAAVIYTVNNGAPQTVALTHGTGNTWSGAIPHQGAGSTVNYYIEATDTQDNTRASASWTFVIVSFHWPPINLVASDGQLDQTVITWLAPVNPGLLASWFGPDTPVNEDEAVARLMAEHNMGKLEALETWRGLFPAAERQFIQYRLYRDGTLLAQTTELTFTDNANQGSVEDVTYTYTVSAQFTSGESDPSIADTGFWSGTPTIGGPDAFGYTWRNSNGPAGPVYEWVDIAGLGTVVPLGDDNFAGPFDLGFTFPFYGEMETQVFIGSNGFLSFGAGNGSLGNQNLPNTQVPNNLIAAFWDDLNPGNAASGDVYYYADAANSRFIVQFQQIVAFGGSVPMTFEFILEASGLMKFEYQDMDEADINQATIGIENADGSIGLTARFDATGSAIGDQMSYHFLPPSNCEPVDCAGLVEVEPNEGWNDNNASWNVIHCGETRCGMILANATDTDTDWYLYTHFGGDITVTLDVSDFNGRLSLREQAVDGQTITSANTFPRCYDEAFTVHDLASGAYYLVVEHTGDADVEEAQSYNLSLVCSGDPCSGHQPIECTGTPEVEPNEGWNAVPPNANYGEIAQNQTICGSVTAVGGVRDMDWFHFHQAATGDVTFNAAIDAFDAALFLTQFDPNGNVVAEINDAPACAPEVLSVAGLPAGDYFIAIGHNTFEGVPTPQAYSLTFGQAAMPEDPCDNYVDVGNFHDTWNTSRPAPQFVHHDGTGCPGGISTPGRDEVIRLVLAQTTDLRVTMLGDGLADEAILLLGNCQQPSSSCGAAVNAHGPDDVSEVLTLQNLPAGDYFVVADFAGAGETHPYWLQIVDLESDLAEGRPLAFALEPCHPNPFNPSTTIAWSQPGLAQTTLIVHDLRGALVEELDLGLRGAGRHAYVWDASRLGSGVYFYTLKSGDVQQTRKAVLVK